MRHIDEGIILHKAELTALLEFCGKDKDNDSLSSVHISVELEKCRAYATDGHRAVECVGVAELGANGEWAIHREFVDQARKLLTGEQSILLEVSGASLHSAQVRDDEGMELSSLNWPHDAASAQATIPALRERVTIPARLGRSAPCLTMSAKLLASVAPVAKAAGRDCVDLYLPAQRGSGIVFRVDGSLNTWTGIVMPVMQEGDETTGRKKRSAVDRAIDDLKQAGGGTQVSMTTMDGETVEL